MPTLIKYVSIFTFLVLLSGCGNLQRQSRTFDTTGTGGITIDASQRAIYSVTKQYPGGLSWKAFCAEPSPDALSALASSFGLDASIGSSIATKALGLATNNQDSTASFGLRTQTIQILRDAMYRLCEGYASGALDNTGFTRLQRRYQHIMLALLAIEQITGPVVASQIALTSNSSAGLGKNLAEISKLIADSAAEVATAQQKLADAQSVEKSLSDKTTEQVPDLKDQKVSAAADTASKSTKLKAAKAHYATLEEKLKNAEKIMLSATSNATAFATSGVHALGTSSIAGVSADVKDIVKTLITHDYTKDLCADVLLSKDGDEIVDAKNFAIVAHMCAKAFVMSTDESTKFLLSVNSKVQLLEDRKAAAERKVQSEKCKAEAEKCKAEAEKCKADQKQCEAVSPAK